MTNGNVPGRVLMPPFQVLRSLPPADTGPGMLCCFPFMLQRSSDYRGPQNKHSMASEELKWVGIHIGMWIQRGWRGKLHPLKLAANGTSLMNESSEVNEPALGKQMQAASHHLFVLCALGKGFQKVCSVIFTGFEVSWLTRLQFPGQPALPFLHAGAVSICISPVISKLLWYPRPPRDGSDLALPSASFFTILGCLPSGPGVLHKSNWLSCSKIKLPSLVALLPQTPPVC